MTTLTCYANVTSSIPGLQFTSAGWDGGELSGRQSPARGSLGLCTPLTLIPAHPDGCPRSCSQNGRGQTSSKDPSSTWRFHVAAGSSANDVTWPVCDDSRNRLSRALSESDPIPGAGFRTCLRSHSCYMAESGFIQVRAPLRASLSRALVLFHL